MNDESYILRLLDECREEIRVSDSKASIIFAASRFQTPTSCPTAINRCAIDDPIRPVPHTPIFMT